MSKIDVIEWGSGPGSRCKASVVPCGFEAGAGACPCGWRTATVNRGRVNELLAMCEVHNREAVRVTRERQEARRKLPLPTLPATFVPLVRVLGHYRDSTGNADFTALANRIEEAKHAIWNEAKGLLEACAIRCNHFDYRLLTTAPPAGEALEYWWKHVIPGPSPTGFGLAYRIGQLVLLEDSRIPPGHAQLEACPWARSLQGHGCHYLSEEAAHA